MTVVKLYPDPSRFEYLTFADFAEVATFVTDPAYTQFSGVPLITVDLKRCRFVQEDNQKRNLKTPD